MIQLRSREKKIAGVCIVLVLIAVVHLIIVSPSLKKRAELDGSIRRAHAQLEDLRLLEREYSQILEETKRIRSRMAEQKGDFALFSFLDQTASRLNLKSNLTSMKPSRRVLDTTMGEDMVEIRLEGVSLENLVAYIYEIERAGGATAIASLRVQPESRLGGGLNVSMLVTSVGRP